MAGIIEHDGYAFEFVEDWARLPEGMSFFEVAGVAVDKDDRVFVFSRGDHPMTIFDREGNFLGAWGHGLFTRPHGIDLGFDGALYCTDQGDHTVRKLTLDGDLLMTIGIPGEAAPPMSGTPFNNCTHSTLSPQGDIYVSDGYANARVHKYDKQGRHLFSWGEQGNLPGQFYVPHNIECDANGLVYVADRENNRIQVFDGNGTYLRHFGDMIRPNAFIIVEGDDPHFIVAEGGPLLDQKFPYRNLGPRVGIWDAQGHCRHQVGEGNVGTGPEQFIAPHGIAMDSRGDLYVAEVACSPWPVLYPGVDRPDDLRTLRKLRRLRR